MDTPVLFVLCFSFEFVSYFNSSVYMKASQCCLCVLHSCGGIVHLSNGTMEMDNDCFSSLLLLQGEFVSARENLEMALSVLGRPVPSSYYTLVPTLLWSLVSHFLFQVINDSFVGYVVLDSKYCASRGTWLVQDL